MSAALELQKLHYAQIVGILPGKVFDGVAPEKTTGPFVIIGQDTLRDIGTKSNREWQAASRFTIHSDAANFRECKTIAGQIMDLFHEQTFSIPPYTVYGTRFSTEDYRIDEVGLTRRGDADYLFWITN